MCVYVCMRPRQLCFHTYERAGVSYHLVALGCCVCVDVGRYYYIIEGDDCFFWVRASDFQRMNESFTLLASI